MRVETLDVRVGGRIDFVYEEASAARDPAWRRQLEDGGLSTAWTARGVFQEVKAPSRLAFRQSLDFGPKSRPQEYRMTVQLRPEGTATYLEMTAEATSTKHWLLLAERNLIGQLDRLTEALTPNRPGPRARP